MNKNKVIKTSISIIILVLIWSIVTKMDIVSSYILPSPSKVLDSLLKMIKSGEIFEDIYISYIRVLKGFFIATLLAFLLAMVRVILPKFNDYYENIVQFLKNVPPLSLISLLILWFGIGETTKIGIIVLTAFFPIYLNTVKGFVSCDKKLLEVGEIYGYSKVNSFFKIRIPYAMSDILVGMRIGLGYSWRAIISAEMIAASTGLGHMILFAQQMSRTDKVIVGILVIGVVGYITDRLFALIIDKALKGSEENGWD
ncbi:MULTISPECIES: ABC transporter permease [Romboutsia]|uniref:Transport protein n=1 Tax=Romboutsia hominis TaxID=1507512 RepID=A0A2P2BMV4_9FIRM|nr:MULTISPECIES: ABC transporter permease [Romboutsia]MDB8789177.1 ABC transporter permease [Romboutsia sp. 1001216sp1]MDB8793186.1 ABC transporter permease [Romboutsia sp. 1001216sp1]MDB8795978.1 ABC transporter permease [Romboutsia sp. 1001216sp1]MDB8799474.1 ABC transporter permease [Romboutsia sp. 1001216sp1]MDB8802238.1 ABC transporter permease [Romboutsia sp. 1001216sp1]